MRAAVGRLLAEAEMQGEGARQIADALRVSARVAVLRLQGQGQRADDVLGLLEVRVVFLDAQQGADARDQLEAVEGVVDEVVRTGHDCVLPQLRATVRRQDDHRQELVPGVGAQISQRLGAILDGHDEIEQDDVDAVALDDLLGVQRRSRRRRLESRRR